ncbi:MAG: triose-phosphate isomerase, partial [Phenylobacterium sp.]
MTAPTPLIAGNWKMNGLSASLAEAGAVADGIGATTARVAICPPATLVQRLVESVAGTRLEVGGQDCRAEENGAFTGDISAEMLADAGAGLVILGHSERRAGYGETDALVAGKTLAALRAGLEPIVCVGETLEQRKAGEALAVVTGQVRGSLP